METRKYTTVPIGLLPKIIELAMCMLEDNFINGDKAYTHLQVTEAIIKFYEERADNHDNFEAETLHWAKAYYADLKGLKPRPQIISEEPELLENDFIKYFGTLEFAKDYYSHRLHIAQQEYQWWKQIQNYDIYKPEMSKLKTNSKSISHIFLEFENKIQAQLDNRIKFNQDMLNQINELMP